MRCGQSISILTFAGIILAWMPVSAAQEIEGTWNTRAMIGGGNVQMGVDNKRAVATGTTESDQAGDFSASALGTEYVFKPDGRFIMTFTGRMMMNFLVSALEVTETGSYEFDGRDLMVRPQQARGWVSISNGPKTPIDETDLAERRYRVVLEDRYATWEGPCSVYETCSDERPVKRQFYRIH